MARTDDVDPRHRVTPPVDVQRELAPVEHAVAPQRADADADALAHRRPIPRDGAVDRFAARARRRYEAPGLGIEIGTGSVARPASPTALGGGLRGEDGSNEQRKHRVGLCTDPGEG